MWGFTVHCDAAFVVFISNATESTGKLPNNTPTAIDRTNEKEVERDYTGQL